MKKRLLIAAMLLTLLFSLTACGQESSTPGASIFTPTPTAGATESTQTALLADTHPITDIVTIGKYKGIEVTPLDLTVTEEELERELILSLEDKVVETDRTTIQNYDLANINFVGKKDGVAFDGGTAENYDLFIGSGSFIPGFEESLLGVSVGATVDIPLTFPENYGSSELAGQDVIFTVTVNSIKELPELTDAFIAENTDFDTLAAYKEDIRTTLQESYDAMIETQFESDVVDAIIADSEFHMDLTTEIDAYINNSRSMYESYASMYGVTLEVYINAMFGMSLSTFNEELPKSAEQIVKRYYVMLAVADAENMEISEMQYRTYVAEMMYDYGYETREALEADYSPKNLENSLLYEQAFAFVLENAIRK